MPDAYPTAVIYIDQEKSLYQLGKKKKVYSCFKICKKYLEIW